MTAHVVHGTAAFADALVRLRERGETDFAKVEPAVREILDAVRSGGDEAVLRYVERFERRAPRQLYIRELDGKGALERLGAAERASLELAAARIAEFHRRERDAMFPGLATENGASAGSTSSRAAGGSGFAFGRSLGWGSTRPGEKRAIRRASS